MKLRKNRKKGFTLIELIVVIAILGILAAILIPQFSGFQEKAKEKAVLSEAKNIATAIDAYHALENKWPTKSDLTTGKYITDAQATDLTVTESGSPAAGDGTFSLTKNGYTAGRTTATGSVAIIP